jgi:hypothetical protein
MHESLVHDASTADTTKRSLRLLIFAAILLGLLLLEPASNQMFRLQLARPLLPLLGGIGCIGTLRIVLYRLFEPVPD